MDSSQYIGITTFTYLFSSLLYALALVYKNRAAGGIATIFASIALLIQTIGIGLRWIESYQMGIGHAPLTNMYESVLFFAWIIVVLQLLFEFKFKTRISGTFALGMAALAMAYASFSTDINKTISPLIPALQSNWLISHVAACFIGYAAFAMTAILGGLYLLANRGTTEEKSKTKSKIGDFLAERLPSLEIIDQLIHKTMIFGFIWLSAGIITGSVWANSAWGTYWSWDAKETWSLITWFFYAITLHIRYTRGWQGKQIAWLSLAGFVCVLFTYYGVNFLLAGLHSYGAS